MTWRGGGSRRTGYGPQPVRVRTTRRGLARLRAGRRWREFVDADGATGIDARLAPQDYAAVSAVLDRFQRDVFRQARRSGRRDRPDAYRLDAFVAAMTAAGAATGLQLTPDQPDRCRTRPRMTDGVPTATGQASWCWPGSTRPLIRVRRSGWPDRRWPGGGVVGGGVGGRVGVASRPLPGRRTLRSPRVGPVSVAWARSLLGDGLVEVLVHDGVDITTYASATRTVPRSIRTALSTRDQTCVVPGCRRRRGLQIDHRHPYAKGGPTSWDNLNLLCDLHHDHKTHRGARLERHDDHWVWWPPPDPHHPDRPVTPTRAPTGEHLDRWPPPTNPHSPAPPPTPTPAAEPGTRGVAGQRWSRPRRPRRPRRTGGRPAGAGTRPRAPAAWWLAQSVVAKRLSTMTTGAEPSSTSGSGGRHSPRSSMLWRRSVITYGGCGWLK